VQVSFFSSVVERGEKVTIGLKFLQVKVEDFPQGWIDGDGTSSLLTFGSGLPVAVPPISCSQYGNRCQIDIYPDRYRNQRTDDLVRLEREFWLVRYR